MVVLAILMVMMVACLLSLSNYDPSIRLTAAPTMVITWTGGKTHTYMHTLKYDSRKFVSFIFFCGVGYKNYITV